MPLIIPECNFILVDDHALFASSFAELLRSLKPDAEVDSFNTIAKAKIALKSKAYTFLILDFMMPGEDPNEFILHCKSTYPTLIIIILSSVLDVGVIKSNLKAGVDGYLSKLISVYELKRALEATYARNVYISSDLAGKLASNFLSLENNVLTKRELEIVRLTAKGYTVVQIANSLHISPVTVMTHRRNINTKLGLHSAAEITKYAYDNGLN